MGRSGIAVEARKRVVIVDDSKTMQAVLDQILSLRLRLDVVGVASDATSAVSLIRSLRPDLVTIDLVMPYIDGRKLLEMLGDMPDVRKVVVSGQVSDNPAIAASLRTAGADACIDKRHMSSDPAAFCAKIRAVLAKPKAATRTLAQVKTPCRPVAVSARANVIPIRYPIPSDERARLDALRHSGLASDSLDVRLDLLTAHMAAVADFPTCLMTFVDRDRQWVKSAYGFARGSMPRVHAFCNYTLCEDDVFVVSNAAVDPRFANNPLVTGEHRIRTYIGCPITSNAGVRLGAICLLDSKPRRVTPKMIASLRSMAQIATQMVEGSGIGLARAA